MAPFRVCAPCLFVVFACSTEPLAPAADTSTAAAQSLPGYVHVKAGQFTMGSPESEVGRHVWERSHPVLITRDYWLKATEVTQGEWFALMGTSPSMFTECGDDCPVEQVSWWEAMAYCNALSMSEGLEPCYEVTGCDPARAPNDGCDSLEWAGGLDCEGYRLPTEAEWEYAARAGTTGAQYGDLMAIGWYSENSKHRTHPVGEKEPNAWGLHDMIGNVWEWTWDWYADYPDAALGDPMGPPTGDEKTFRGGSWIFNSIFMRVANRNHNVIDHRGQHLGFRPARSVTSAARSPNTP